MNIIKVKSENEIKYLLIKYNDRYTKPLSKEKIDELAKKFFNYASVYKVEENNIDLGYIAFYSNNIKEKKAFISQICVSKDFTKRGIGKLLINKCIEECKEKKIALIQLSVYNDNKVAVEFYQRNGFYIYSQNDSEQCTYMEKKISQ